MCDVFLFCSLGCKNSWFFSTESFKACLLARWRIASATADTSIPFILFVFNFLFFDATLNCIIASDFGDDFFTSRCLLMMTAAVAIKGTACNSEALFSKSSPCSNEDVFSLRIASGESNISSSSNFSSSALLLSSSQTDSPSSSSLTSKSSSYISNPPACSSCSCSSSSPSKTACWCCFCSCCSCCFNIGTAADKSSSFFFKTTAVARSFRLRCRRRWRRGWGAAKFLLKEESSGDCAGARISSVSMIWASLSSSSSSSKLSPSVNS